MKILLLLLLVSCSTTNRQAEKTTLLKAFEFCSTRGGLDSLNKFTDRDGDPSYIGACMSHEPFYLTSIKETKNERKFSTVPKDIN